MNVQYDIELVGGGLLQNPIDALEELRIDSVGRVLGSMSRPLHRHADRLEPGIGDLLEVTGLEFQPPIAFLRCLQCVAEIDPAPQRSVDRKNIRFLIRLLRDRKGRAGDECRECEKKNVPWRSPAWEQTVY